MWQKNGEGWKIMKKDVREIEQSETEWDLFKSGRE